MNKTAGVVLLAVAAGLAMTACSTKLKPAGPAPATGTTVVTVTAETSATETAAGSTTTSAAATTHRFPNTQPYVEVVGYADAGHLLRFQVVDRHQRAGLQDEFDHVPGDQGTHQLPLSASVIIDGIPNGDSAICPAATDGKCTTAELVDAAKAPPTPLVVQLVVDGNDQITEVAEQVGMVL